ncbi:MAG TPA: hypothetical protein VN824_01285 [Puia sp.]|nr:hypothetical protein [Puia sp.]
MKKIAIPFTIARFKDTLYIMTFPRIGLYWMDLKSPGVAQPVPNAPSSLSTNNLTCDKNGLLYYVEGSSMLSRLNPHTGVVEELGPVPDPPAGDMTFYKLLPAEWVGRHPGINRDASSSL